MQVEEPVVLKMAELQELFTTTKRFAEQASELFSILEYLHSLESEFVSIAYEATGMALAQKDLTVGKELTLWTQFLEKHAADHAVQVHIGLGWALGQYRMDVEPYLKASAPFLAWRIWDGYGYYDGFFRKRKAWQGLLPDGIGEKAAEVYTQGIGRSLWYVCKADISKIRAKISNFPLEKQQHLWRGVGIASTYVGGISSEQRAQLWAAAADCQPQLAAGSALAIMSRAKANTLLDDNKQIAKEWCGLTIRQMLQLVEQKAKNSVNNTPWVYHTWIQKIDEEFKIE